MNDCVCCDVKFLKQHKISAKYWHQGDWGQDHEFSFMDPADSTPLCEIIIETTLLYDSLSTIINISWVP